MGRPTSNGPRSSTSTAHWRSLGEGQNPTHGADGPDAVIDRMIGLGEDRHREVAAIASVGIGVPGLYDPATGRTRFWRTCPAAGPVSRSGLASGRRSGSRSPSSTMPARSGSPSFASARVGASLSMVGLVLGTGVGGVIAIDGRVVLGHDGSAGELGHQTLDPDGPMRLRQSRLPRGVRPRRPFRGSVRHGDAGGCRRCGREPATRGRWPGWREIGRWLGIGIANMIAVVSPDRVVIGGGVAAAGDVLFDADPGRARAGASGRRISRPSSSSPPSSASWAGLDRRGGPWRRAGRAGVRSPSMTAATSSPAGSCSRTPSPAAGSSVADGRIDAVELDPALDDAGPLFAPGFVDIHVHGWGGHDAMGDEAALDGMARALAAPRRDLVPADRRHAPLDVLERFADRVRAWRPAAPADGAEPLGFNLEGPFLADARRGAHDPDAPRRAGRRPRRVDRARRRRTRGDDDRARAAGCARAHRTARSPRRRGLARATRQPTSTRRVPGTRAALDRRRTSSTR